MSNKESGQSPALVLSADQSNCRGHNLPTQYKRATGRELSMICERNNDNWSLCPLIVGGGTVGCVKGAETGGWRPPDPALSHLANWPESGSLAETLPHRESYSIFSLPEVVTH